MNHELHKHHEHVRQMRAKQLADWKRQQRTIDHFVAKANLIFGRERYEVSLQEWAARRARELRIHTADEPGPVAHGPQPPVEEDQVMEAVEALQQIRLD